MKRDGLELHRELSEGEMTKILDNWVEAVDGRTQDGLYGLLWGGEE
jgi:hypothetical protein